jgi:preprotein translocase subunit Sec63
MVHKDDPHVIAEAQGEIERLSTWEKMVVAAADAILAILGLRRGASLDDVQRKFRELAAKRHPDTHGGSTAAFQDLERARREAMKQCVSS